MSMRAEKNKNKYFSGDSGKMHRPGFDVGAEKPAIKQTEEKCPVCPLTAWPVRMFRERKRLSVFVRSEEEGTFRHLICTNEARHFCALYTVDKN